MKISITKLSFPSFPHGENTRTPTFWVSPWRRTTSRLNTSTAALRKICGRTRSPLLFLVFSFEAPTDRPTEREFCTCSNWRANRFGLIRGPAACMHPRGVRLTDWWTDRQTDVCCILSSRSLARIWRWAKPREGHQAWRRRSVRTALAAFIFSHSHCTRARALSFIPRAHLLFVQVLIECALYATRTLARTLCTDKMHFMVRPSMALSCWSWLYLNRNCGLLT
jgi:hypothetical protein